MTPHDDPNLPELFADALLAGRPADRPEVSELLLFAGRSRALLPSVADSTARAWASGILDREAPVRPARQGFWRWLVSTVEARRAGVAPTTVWVGRALAIYLGILAAIVLFGERRPAAKPPVQTAGAHREAPSGR